MTQRFGSMLIALLASTALTACGTAGVKLSNTADPAGNDPEQVKALLKAAGDKAVVVSVPVSKLVIKISPVKSEADAPPPPSGKDGKKKKEGGAANGKDTKSPGDGGGGSDSGTSAVTQTVTTATATYSVSVVPVADSATTFRATPVNNFFSSNNFGVTKIANSDVATTATNEFTDQTQSRITAIGGIIVGALKLGTGVGALLAPLPPGASPPSADKCSATAMDFAVEARPDSGAAANWHAFHVSDTCWRYAFEVETRQRDILSRAAFRDQVTRGETVQAWPVPACLEIKLLIAKTAVAGQPAGEKDADVVVPLTVSDPDNVRLVGIPDKGKIALHPICDADVSDNAVDRWSTAFDAISALETQAKAIEGARSRTSP